MAVSAKEPGLDTESLSSKASTHTDNSCFYKAGKHISCECIFGSVVANPRKRVFSVCSQQADNNCCF